MDDVAAYQMYVSGADDQHLVPGDILSLVCPSVCPFDPIHSEVLISFY